MRYSEASRATKETAITVALDLDGIGETVIDTGNGFFDHMLSAFARHGLFDLEVRAQGDLEVDAHHTVEDVGIVLGQAVAQEVDGQHRQQDQHPVGHPHPPAVL